MAQAVVLAPWRFQVSVLVPGAIMVLGGWLVLAIAGDHRSLPSFAAMWLAMSVAMMIPTALRPMMRAADGSAVRAWQFVAGFIAVWLAAGVPSYLVMGGLDWTPGWIAAAWLLAGAYQLTPWMQRQLFSCRSVRFDGAATRFGVGQGVRCVASCSPVMLAAMVTAMALPGLVLPILALVGVTALLCWEKQPGTTTRSVAAIGLAMLLVAVGGVVLMGGGGPAGHHSAGSSTS